MNKLKPFKVVSHCIDKLFYATYFQPVSYTVQLRIELRDDAAMLDAILDKLSDYKELIK